jgi:hypothetical protein
VAHRLGAVRPIISGRSVAPVHGRGRCCKEEGCDTVLSVYNATSFCSLHERVAQASPSKAGDEQERVTLTCALASCGRSFETPNPKRVYCSDRCRVLAFSLRTKGATRAVAPGVA